MGIFIFIASLLALAWFWQDSLKSRERAIQAAALACREIGAQLLDQTVALKKLSSHAPNRGRLICGVFMNLNLA